MKRSTHFGLLTLVTGIALTAVVLLTSSLSIAATNGQVDLSIRVDAPTYADAGSTYVVNISYANVGTEAAPDNWVVATLPPGTEFVEATYTGGAPRPPDVIDGNVLTWIVTPLWADSTWGHILITLQTDETLPEGETLTIATSIATSAPEPDTTNNEASVTTIISYMGGSQMQVQAHHGMPGVVLTYETTINLTQHARGGATERWVTLIDTLPSTQQVRFLGWTGTITGVVIDGQTLHWQGQVQAGEPLSLQYQLGVEGVVTAGTAISNAAMLSWTGHQMQLGPVTTVVTIPHGVLGLRPEQGGQLYHQHGVTLTVPPGAVTDTTRLQLGPLFTETKPVDPPGGLSFANRAFELIAFPFGEQIGQFNAPLTITMNYTDTDVAGLNRETLRMWTRSGPGNPWTMADEPFDVTSGTLSFTTTQSGQFALFCETSVDPAIQLRAPAHVAIGSTYVVNVSYTGTSGESTPDSWVTVTLPPETQFVEATDSGGASHPPDVIDNNVLTWTLTSLSSGSVWDHFQITLQTDEALPEGQTLTVVGEIAESEGDPDATNNTDSATSTAYSMGGSVKQVSTRQAMPGDVLTYTIRLAHQLAGGTSGRWVTLTDTLPFSHQVRFLGWSGEVTGEEIDGHMLRWQGQVQAGEPLTLQYRLGVEGEVTPGTVISNAAALGWDGYQMQLGPVTTVVTIPHGVMGLGPDMGGQLHHQCGVTLTVPPGAISDTTRFRLTPTFTDTHPTPPPGGLLFGNRAFELNAFRFGEPIGEFNAPLTITMNYSDTDVVGLKRETLRLWTRSGPQGPWTVLGEPIGVMVPNSLSFTTTHLSQFALFGQAEHSVYLPMIAR